MAATDPRADAASSVTMISTARDPRVDRYAPGSIVADYQLVEVVREGATATVWRAKNRTLDVDVALSLTRADRVAEAGLAERMLQDARVAASVGHPALHRLFDFDVTDFGDPFFAAELLRGETLEQAMQRKGAVQPTRAAQMLLPIVDALAFVHERGVAHGDVRPENVFLARLDGQRLQPKLTNFGLGKLERKVGARREPDAVPESALYFEPSEWRGDPEADAGSDAWAVAVVLYRMVTGRHPFDGGRGRISVSDLVSATPRSIAEHGVDDAELDRILLRALAKDRAQRQPKLRAFGRDLAAWLLAHGVRDDVCGRSLKVWLDDASAPGALNSFFPSNAPEPEHLEIVAANPPESPGAPADRAPVDAPARANPEAPARGARGAGWLDRAEGRASWAPPLDAPAVPARPIAAPRNDAAERRRLVAWALSGVVVASLGVVLYTVRANYHWTTTGGFARSGAASADGSGESSGDGSGDDESAADEEAEVEAQRPRSRRLPYTGYKLAPLPKTGPNAPLLYIDDPPKPRPPAKSQPATAASD